MDEGRTIKGGKKKMRRTENAEREKKDIVIRVKPSGRSQGKSTGGGQMGVLADQEYAKKEKKMQQGKTG